MFLKTTGQSDNFLFFYFLFFNFPGLAVLSGNLTVPALFFVSYTQHTTNIKLNITALVSKERGGLDNPLDPMNPWLSYRFCPCMHTSSWAFQVAYTNIREIRIHFYLIYHYFILAHSPTIAAFSETLQNSSVPTDRLLIPGYKDPNPFRRPAPDL